MTLRIGEAVVTSGRNPAGHNRLPRYLRAKRGRIEAVHARYPLADEHAAGREVRERLYTVAFEARDLWDADAELDCVIHADLWESYFELRDHTSRRASHPLFGADRSPSEPAATASHGHRHPHANDDSQAAALTRRVDALLAVLERAELTSNAEVDATLERFLANAGPSNGARLVARAWVDPEFKARLLADANAASIELGLDLSHWAPVNLRAVENTALVHNVVVCTLCSCYPIALLGPSPGWYKSEAYRSRVVREPRAVLREFGCAIADSIRLNVWDSTAEVRYLVVPRRPPDTGGFSESELAALVPRDALIGTAVARHPADSDAAATRVQNPRASRD